MSTPVFVVNWYFARWLPFVFDRLDFSQGDVPPPVMLEGGCGASNYSCWVCGLKYTPTRPGKNAGKWWPQSDCGVNVVARRRISDLLSGFTCLCVACFKLCASLSRWPGVENSVLVGEGWEREAKWGERRVRPTLWKPGPTQDTNVNVATPFKRKWWACSRLKHALP